jgi:cell division protein FtsB
MDLRLGPPPRGRLIPSSILPSRISPGRFLPRPEDGLRAVMEQAPRAEAVAARWVEQTRPGWSWMAREWRRLGTAAAVVLIVGVLLHAMFGANGMVIYNQKRAEMQALQAEVDRLQKENTQYAEQIKLLKSDPAAIEKEAREQLHYTRKGEVVFVAPDRPVKPPTGRAKNGK